MEVVEHHRGDLTCSQGLSKYELETQGKSATLGSLNDKERLNVSLQAKTKTLAKAFLRRADRARCGHLLDDLENQYTRYTDQYRVDLASALTTVETFVKPQIFSKHKQQVYFEEEIDTAFAQY